MRKMLFHLSRRERSARSKIETGEGPHPKAAMRLSTSPAGRGVSLALLLFLAACGTATPLAPEGPSKAPPKFTGVKVGKPYSIAGKWYRPAPDPYYDRTGEASWYGPGFNGKRTANGEIFNQYDMTAAHPTLPMPSFVRVTNLGNGREAVVRVNDRGPFHSDRIIDLSKAAAEKIGLIATGVAPVRVQYLKEESEIYIASNGTIWPGMPKPAGRDFAKALMPREKLPPGGAEDDRYYDLKEEYLPAPLEVADNSGIVVESVPVISVQMKNLLPTKPSLPPVIKPAMAEEKPLVSARELETKVTQERAEWAVRVASFAARDNAEKLMQKLTGIGQPEMQPVLIDGREWYRVYLHPLKGQEKEPLMANLEKIGLKDARIVE